MADWKGPLVIADKNDAATYTHINTTAGQITIDQSCTVGFIHITGVGTTIVDNSGAGCTVISTILNLGSISDSVWDEIIADHVEIGSTGESLNNVSAGASPTIIASAVWDKLATDHEVPGSFGEKIGRKLLTLAKFLGLK